MSFGLKSCLREKLNSSIILQYLAPQITVINPFLLLKKDLAWVEAALVAHMPILSNIITKVKEGSSPFSTDFDLFVDGKGSKAFAGV